MKKISVWIMIFMSAMNFNIGPNKAYAEIDEKMMTDEIQMDQVDETYVDEANCINGTDELTYRIIEEGDCGAEESDSLWWQIQDIDNDGYGDILVISGTGAMKDYDDLKAPWYKNYHLANLELLIEKGVTHIGNNAFYDCSGFTGPLEIPNSVTSIGDYAFAQCMGFSGNLVIPNSVTSIGSGAFRRCSGFKGTLTISENISNIEDFTFDECAGFTGSLNIPNGIINIGERAFIGCRGFNGNLILPNKVITIGAEAFAECTGFNGNLVIPASVTSIGRCAFWQCSGFNGNLNISNEITNMSIGDFAFYECGFTGDLVIPENIIDIGMGAFENCSGFTGDLTIPKSLTMIRPCVFSGCSGLTGVNLPNNITSIGFSAFENCTGLTGSIYIPDSVSSILDKVFSGCDNLYQVVFLNSKCVMCDSNDLVSKNVKIKGFKDSTAITYAEKYAYTYDVISEYGDCGVTELKSLKWKVQDTDDDGHLDTLVISGSGEMMNYEAGSAPWYDYHNMHFKVVFENGITSIGNNAFYDCGGFIGELNIPNSVTRIGDNAFSGCNHLTGEINFSEDVAYIGCSAFKDCEKLDKIIFNNLDCKIHDSKDTICSTTAIKGYKESSAMKYAEKYGQTFEVMIPKSVTNLKAISTGKNKVKLTWTASDGAEGYLIYGQKQKSYGYVGMTTKGTSYTDTKALDSDYNFYWVFPYVKNSSGIILTGGCTKYVYTKGVCLAVTNLKATSLNNGLKLTWTESEGADGYLIYGIRPEKEYGYIGMTTKGTHYLDSKASKKAYSFYWVFPYHTDENHKMVIGGTAKYVYGKAK